VRTELRVFFARFVADIVAKNDVKRLLSARSILRPKFVYCGKIRFHSRHRACWFQRQCKIISGKVITKLVYMINALKVKQHNMIFFAMFPTDPTNPQMFLQKKSVMRHLFYRSIDRSLEFRVMNIMITMLFLFLRKTPTLNPRNFAPLYPRRVLW
jgi:hypothetical protein